MEQYLEENSLIKDVAIEERGGHEIDIDNRLSTAVETLGSLHATGHDRLQYSKHH